MMTDLVTIILMALSVNSIITVIRWFFESKKDKYLQYREKCFEEHKMYENNISEKQIVYKIDGDFTGDITGDNVTVILMNGDMTGNIKSNDGNVVLIRGDITGDIVANKVICPTNLSNASVTEEPKNITCEDCKYFQIKHGSYYCSSFDLKMSSTNRCFTFFEPKNQNKETIINPNKVIYEGRTIIDLTTTDIESPSDIAKGKIGYLKTGERVVGTGEFVNKLDGKQYHNCADCGYARPKTLSLSGIDTSNDYDCTKFNRLVRGDYCACDKFIRKSCDTCHYSLDKDADGDFECYKRGYCEYVPREEEQNKKCCANCNHYQDDSYAFIRNGDVLKKCNRFTCMNTNIQFTEDPSTMCCQCYVKRNPAKDVDSPKLPIKTTQVSLKDKLKRLVEESPKPVTTVERW